MSFHEQQVGACIIEREKKGNSALSQLIEITERDPSYTLPLISDNRTTRNSHTMSELDVPLSSNLPLIMDSVGGSHNTFYQDSTDLPTRSSSLAKVKQSAEFLLTGNIKESRKGKPAKIFSQVRPPCENLRENIIGFSMKSLNNSSKSSINEIDISSLRENVHDSSSLVEMESTQGISNVTDMSASNLLVNDIVEIKGDDHVQQILAETFESKQDDISVNENSEMSLLQTGDILQDPDTKVLETCISRRSSLPPRACKMESQRRLRAEYHKYFVSEFNCGVCKESFSQKLLLKRHIAQAHGQKQKFTEDERKSPRGFTFFCPLCKGTYSRKYGLKRHFFDKHPNVCSIPCLECKKVAKNIEDYLSHTDIHKALKSKSSHFTTEDTESGQLKCSNCLQIFQNDDTLRLHKFNHKMADILSKAELNFPSILTASRKTCTCNCNLPTDSITNYPCLGQTFLGHLPADMMTTVEQSVNTVAKLTSGLDSMAHCFRTGISSAKNEELLQAMSLMNSLSDGLSSLTSTLGLILRIDDGTRVKKESEENTKSIHNEFSEPMDEECHGEDLVESKSVLEDDKIGGFAVNIQIKSEEKTIVSVPVVKSRKVAKRGRKKLKAPRQVCKGRERHDHICLHCGKEFKDCVNLRRHNIIHQEKRPFKCKLCKLSFRRGHHLKRHMAKHSDVRPFKCDKCEFAAKTSTTLRTHSHLHDEDRNLPCEKCSFIGRTLAQLERHEKKHNPCSLCSYIPTDDADYKLHKRSHLNFSCKECDYSCYSSWQLRRHSKKHEPPNKEQQKYCCELCGYSCFEKRQFDYHMTRHKNKTPYSCSLCDYKCSSRTSFEAHKLMHAGLKPYLCSICGASFRRTSYLNNHMLIHKDEKKHVCQTCGHPFRSRYNLKVHEMTHTGEKQFKCHLCHFACRRNKELRLHLEKHALLDPPEDIKPPLLETVKKEGE